METVLLCARKISRRTADTVVWAVKEKKKKTALCQSLGSWGGRTAVRDANMWTNARHGAVGCGDTVWLQVLGLIIMKRKETHARY